MDHVKQTMRLEYLTDFAREAAQRLGVSKMVGVDLDPDIGREIGSLIEDRAQGLQRDADKQAYRGGGISSG